MKADQPLCCAFWNRAWWWGIGAFSYSLYLIHMPASWLLKPFLKTFHLVGTSAFVIEMFVFIPFALFVSYLFHLVV